MNFNPQDCINYAKMLLCHDEVELALECLKNIPAAYRESPPKEITEFKNKVLSLIMTPHDYMKSDGDSRVDVERSIWAINSMVRGILLKKEVEKLNEIGLTPHIVDVGPGEYFAPIALGKLGYKFTYKDIGINIKAKQLALELINPEVLQAPKDNQPVIFAAMEIIEHLPNPKDLAIEMHKHCPRPPIAIHLSTPCYTYDLKETFEEIQDLPHLRAYTPHEFIMTASELFPGYYPQLYNSLIMSLRGVHRDHPCPDPIAL